MQIGGISFAKENYLLTILWFAGRLRKGKAGWSW